MPTFRDVKVELVRKGNGARIFPPGEYIFAFKNNTRQVGWGIDPVPGGKYHTYATPSGGPFVRDGWPSPWEKESVLSKPVRVVARKPWNVAKIYAVPVSKTGPFINQAYYMSWNADPWELGHGQAGSPLSLVGSVGGSWVKIDEKPSGVLYNEVEFM